MEDASKEFQVFLSPKRDNNSFTQMPKENSVLKHRIVPVISKMLSSSSSFSSFSLMNQKKTSVYTAVSGVCFQETEHHDSRNSNLQRSRRESKKKRRQSVAVATVLPPTGTNQDSILVPGARRSRSLTSMESAYNTTLDSGKKVVEITHPCTPVMMSAGKSSGSNSSRRGRYARIRDRRRSQSQSRNHADLKQQDSDCSEKTDTPIRPRRTRSASRSRKVAISSVTYDNIGNSSDRKSSYQKNFTIESNRSKDDDKSTIESENRTKVTQKSNNTKDIDFSVNENDWEIYEEIVTKQLDNILKRKEEPEGGYFSLEREDEFEKSSSTSEEYFQKDNDTESIYVAPTFAEKPTDSLSSDTITIEEIYREVLFNSSPYEVGYPEDEGLYEEIFIENKNEPHCSFPSTNVSPVNIVVTPNLPPPVPTRNKKAEKSPATTVVYIGGNETVDMKDTLISPTYKSSQSQPIVNGITIINPNHSKENHKQWCGCKLESAQVPSHSSFCIHSKSNMFSSKYSNLRSEITTKISNDNIMENNSFSINPSNLTALDRNFLPLEYSRKDIDLDMFTPRNYSEKRSSVPRLSSSSCSVNAKSPINDLGNSIFYTDKNFFNKKVLASGKKKTKSDPNLLSSTKLSIFQNQSTLENFESSLSSVNLNRKIDSSERNLASKPIISPPDFKAFLRDSLFNPETESLQGDNESLVIKNDQVITCITDDDSSSSEDEDSSTEESGGNSQWLEAENEFEFRGFSEPIPKVPTKRKKLKKPILNKLNIPIKISSQHQLRIFNSKSFDVINSDTYDMPERPSRRRKCSDFWKKENT